MLPSFNLDASAAIGLVGIIAILFGTASMKEGYDISAKDSKYAHEGVRTQGEVTRHFEGSRTVETAKHRERPAHKHTHTVHHITVSFRLPNGTAADKTLEVDHPVESSRAGSTPTVQVTYLPEDPPATAQIEGNWDYDTGSGSNRMQKGIWSLAGGLAALGLACYRERAAFKELKIALKAIFGR